MMMSAQIYFPNLRSPESVEIRKGGAISASALVAEIFPQIRGTTDG
jgi:hypothetical protein